MTTLTVEEAGIYEAGGFTAEVREGSPTLLLRVPFERYPKDADGLVLAPEDAHALEVVLFAARTWIQSVAEKRVAENRIDSSAPKEVPES